MKEEKQKLMLISPMLHQGGFERVCITTARLLEPYFDITIVIFDSANIAYDVKGLTILDINMGVRRGKVQKLLNICRRSLRVRKLKRQLKTDIAYSFGPSANLVNAFSKTGREKVWLGFRNYTDVEEAAKVRIFTKLADKIICCSKEIEKELNVKFGFNKTSVLYNMYDVAAIQKEADAGSLSLPWGETDKEGRKIRNLVSMGRDDDMKGFWHMLKVFSLVHKEMPETRLVLLGAGTFAHYKRMAEEFGITNDIYFAGLQREPYRYLKKGEIYLLTSLNEGFPNALAEGMALGLAPVCVNCKTGPAEILLDGFDTAAADAVFEECTGRGEIPVIYGDYGILLPVMEKERDLDVSRISGEEKNMAAVITKLLREEKQLVHYQKAARGRAGLFTYESYVEQFLGLAKEEK